ncbi:MAG: hypothetical protein IJE07_11915 [Clostridia bacterium]|nr:hypothetical protein [Clostridia bacterium]
MFRTLIAILLILVGIVGIAGGIWGFSLQIGSDVDPNVLNAAKTALEYADSAVNTADDWLSEVTGGKFTLTGVLNDAVGDGIDLTNELSVKTFAYFHALEILLCGIIGVETGLLMFKSRRR